MARFYISRELEVNSTIELPTNILRHLHVLRIRPSETVILFNGNGYSYNATLNELEKRRACVTVNSKDYINHESPLNITLIQSISSSDRMDFTIQKSVELGIKTIQPIVSERSIVRLNAERAEKRVVRWQEIVISACEQCGRNIVPKVLPILSFDKALNHLPEMSHLIFLSLKQHQVLNSIKIDANKNISFMVGPEGGWTQDEEQSAIKSGFQAIKLGNRVLRTETASLAAIAAMQTLWGDF